MSGSDLTPQKEDGPPNAEATAEAKGVETAPLQQAHEVVDETKSSVVERDEFGLPIKNALRKKVDYDTSSDESKSTAESPANGSISNSTSVHTLQEKEQSLETRAASRRSSEDGCKDEEDSKGHDSAKDEKRGSKTAPAELSDVLGGNTGTASGWSHQALAPQKVEQDVDEKEDEWQEMPAYAPYDIYNDDNKLIAREAQDSDDEAAYKGLGGAGKGYTRIQMDDDAKSASSMEENTEYLFKAKGTEVYDEDEEARDPLAQLQATKDLLTEGQRIAYVGVTRLNMVKMTKSLEDLESTKKTRKSRGVAIESMSMWAQKMMVRLYLHMDINSSEQLMIEQLAEHGVQPADLTPPLMANARVKNPLAEENDTSDGFLKSPNPNDSSRSPKPNSSNSPSLSTQTSPRPDSLASPRPDNERRPSTFSVESQASKYEPLPAYEEHQNETAPEVKSPDALGTQKNIDIDIRWTVLCDLFLVLLADSVYDSRSRKLLELVGEALKISPTEICRFEKRATDSLEMQESKNKETWDEAEHLEARRKKALRRRYMMMGLATVGGTIIIGASAGALAPLIGAGLAAGFTTVGVSGTAGFLAGAGGTALIGGGAAVAGGAMGLKASHRRTGAVQTFEYRPLHNNKRVNLIVTISGWMNSKVDDVRLPFSTVDPVMGDIYSVLWEPEMLQSMGDTINVLANEALSQTVQQVLGSTILIALMASLQVPILLAKLTYLIDNPWSVSIGRANAAGLIFADSLIDRNLGHRPITLVGFSLGARVIFAALRELASRGAYGLIQNVYLFGSPIVANKDEYLRARSVVSGRFVNGYASNDWILGYLFRATSGGIMRVAGLAPVEGISGIENENVTSLVNGHMAYRAAMPKLLRLVGWEVESDEFTEIEDPDPENHAQRQRELIQEIDEARKEAEKKPKGRFAFFKRGGKLAQKKTWETYDERSMKTEDDFSTAAAEGAGGSILFDVEAIRRELAGEQIEVKELQSTAPMMKITIEDFEKPESERPPLPNPHAELRQTKSYDDTAPHNVPVRSSSLGGNPSQSSLSNGQTSTENPFNKGYDEYSFSAETLASNKLSPQPTQHSLDGSQASTSPSHSPRFSHDCGVAPPSPLREVENSSPKADVGLGVERPPLRTNMTEPAGSVGVSPLTIEHNAWADGDPDDEDFGKEKGGHHVFRLGD